ncbi:MAG TPA: hypothetical protein GXX15_12885 [Clostridia bacterium]|nr:hypothetical protein [Clostridia bacterium]
MIVYFLGVNLRRKLASHRNDIKTDKKPAKPAIKTKISFLYLKLSNIEIIHRIDKILSSAIKR